MQHILGDQWVLQLGVTFRWMIAQSCGNRKVSHELVAELNCWNLRVPLTVASIVIPAIIQVMILLNTMPKEFDSIGATILQMKTTTEITFAAVQEAVLAEHASQQNTGFSQNQAQKLSNVKQKGANPKWQPKGNKQKGNQK